MLELQLPQPQLLVLLLLLLDVPVHVPGNSNILTMLHFECVVLRIDLGVVMESDSLSLFRGLEERTTSARSQLNSRLGMASPVEMIKIIMISDNE